MLKLVVIASVARACSLSSAEREDRMVGGGVAAEPGCKCVLMSSSAQREWEEKAPHSGCALVIQDAARWGESFDGVAWLGLTHTHDSAWQRVSNGAGRA